MSDGVPLRVGVADALSDAERDMLRVALAVLLPLALVLPDADAETLADCVPVSVWLALRDDESEMLDVADGDADAETEDVTDSESVALTLRVALVVSEELDVADALIVADTE